MKRARLLIGALVFLVVGAAAGAAYGYFTSHGSGSASATTGTAQAVTVQAATGTPTSKLIPGGTADLVLKIDNPNSFAVTITSVNQNGTLTVVGGSGCTSANAGVSVPNQAGLSVSLAAGTGVTVHIPNGASMSNSSNSGCQGASFQIPVTLTVQK